MIHHATRDIPPSALEDCLAFYALIGFVEVQPPAGIAGRAAWLEAARGEQRTQIHLMLVDGAEPNAGHVAVVCAAYDATLEGLRRAGHEIDPRTEHWGSPRSFVRDPAGNLVELMAWRPGENGESGQGTT
jgi:catechol 2,3-dioxygenase-like lactoylglutathione lyase family enzyme